jgi:hypothetical protein
LVNDVSELLSISTHEILITSDVKIPRQEWADRDNYKNNNYFESLFCPQDPNQFPAKEFDFTSLHKTIWELLPSKYKFKMSNFTIELLPSLKSPAQQLIEPLSLVIDLGINDEKISIFHKKLPKFTIISYFKEINFHINQNQYNFFLNLF